VRASAGTGIGTVGPPFLLLPEVGVPHRPSFVDFVPVLSILAGLVLSILRFRAGDRIGGGAAALAGLLLSIVLAVVLDRRATPPRLPPDGRPA
jgi:hypothetical protein